MLSLFESVLVVNDVQQVSVVSNCFPVIFIFCCLSWLSYVSVLHVFDRFEVVLGSVGVVLRLP